MDGFDRMSGGKAMEFLSQSGDPKMFPIAEPLLHSNDCYFSFAGIKNSARQFILEEEEKHGIQGGEVLPNVADICASVQFAIIKHLCRRLQRAMTFVEQQTLIPKDHQALVISGGVASNSAIRSAISMLCKEMEYSLHVPPPYLCTDNGIMIAWNGVEKWAAGIDVIPYNQVDNIDFQANPSVSQFWDPDLCPADNFISRKMIYGEGLRPRTSSLRGKSPMLLPYSLSHCSNSNNLQRAHDNPVVAVLDSETGLSWGLKPPSSSLLNPG